MLPSKARGNVQGGAQTVSAQIVLRHTMSLTAAPWVVMSTSNLNRHWRERFAWLSGETTEIKPRWGQRRDRNDIEGSNRFGYGRQPGNRPAIVIALAKEGEKVCFVYKGSEQAAKALEEK